MLVSKMRTFRPDPALKLSANLYDIYHCCVYSEKLLMMDRVNCPKHVEFYSKNKFEKLLQLVGFIMNKQVMVQKKRHLESRNWNISLKYRGEDTFMFKGRVVKKDGGRIGPRRRNRSSDLTVRSLTPPSDPGGQ